MCSISWPTSRPSPTHSVSLGHGVTAFGFLRLLLVLASSSSYEKHVLLQVARVAERSGTVGARVVPALLVRRTHVRLKTACRPECRGAVGARVIPALLVHRAHVFRQGALLPECARVVGARVVPALLVPRKSLK